MSYDFFVDFQIEDKEDVDNLTNGVERFAEISDVFSRILLLNTVYAIKEKFQDFRGRPDKINADVYAKVGEKDNASGLKALLYSNRNYNDYLKCKLLEISLLGINLPIDISHLPKGSWTIEIPLILKKPFISKDDIPLYIIENPVRKDKVFNIPITSAMAWKGNLRWTMMKLFLEPVKDDSEKFADIRFRHTLLFGTEKGMEEVPTGWTDYLDNLSSDAKEKYWNKLKEFFAKDKVPSLEGMLHFYPTLWDRIDMEVINPHNRATKTGKNPIYYEVVPKGAKGVFRVLYVPFHYIGRYEPVGLLNYVKSDLNDVIDGLKAMMFTYGFSAKKTIGYGVIEETWDREQSRLVVKIEKGSIYEDKFENFDMLKNLVNLI